MRTRHVPLVLAAMVAGCGIAGHVTPPAPSPPEAEKPAPRAPATEQLGCIRHPRIDVWERRLRAERGMGPWARPDLTRGPAYLPRLRPLVSAAGLPPALALLPAVESGFDPDARGRAGERGLWQLRATTARRFGLVVTGARDDRLAPERATRAAARYLRFLHARYGDWPLALAAYNAGEGRIDRARAHRPTATFWELAAAGALPRRSQEYVPRFLALVRLHEDMRRCPPAAHPGAALAGLH
ncbi:MAG TPA: lytic transglycosylase domain-containing protein [Candidatus Binatia bacterium]|nr:lytic transglycosylase domain-containing protein [Candidatus Binatia bacterium]